MVVLITCMSAPPVAWHSIGWMPSHGIGVKAHVRTEGASVLNSWPTL